MFAINGPAKYMKAAGLAPSTNSLMAHGTIAGAGTPPTSSSSPTRNHSPSRHARSDFLNGSGSVTTGSRGRRSADGGRFRRTTPPPAPRPIGRPRRASAGPIRRRGPRTLAGEHLFQVQRFEQVELEVAHVALVVAHGDAFRSPVPSLTPLAPWNWALRRSIYRPGPGLVNRQHHEYVIEHKTELRRFQLTVNFSDFQSL